MKPFLQGLPRARQHICYKTGITVLAVILLTACGAENQTQEEKAVIRSARIFTAQSAGTTQRYEFVGRVEAAQSIDLSFQVGGLLNELPVREGATVEKGGLIAALDPVDFKLALREAQAQLQLAKQDYERKRKLLEEQVVAQSLADDARTLLNLRRVQVEKAQESLSDTKIFAPFEAYVARRHTDSHVNIAPGQPIVRLHDFTELHVIASIPEQLLATVDSTRVANIEAQFDFLPAEKFPLVIRENTGEADQVAQTYEVTFAMPRPEQWNILPGMTATVAVDLRSSTAQANDFTIPLNALVSAPDGSFFVWLYDASTQYVTRQKVLVGTPRGRGVPIIHGLQDGDLIVATGASALQEGMQVRPLGEPTAQL